MSSSSVAFDSPNPQTPIWSNFLCSSGNCFLILSNDISTIVSITSWSIPAISESSLLTSLSIFFQLCIPSLNVSLTWFFTLIPSSLISFKYSSANPVKSALAKAPCDIRCIDKSSWSGTDISSHSVSALTLTSARSIISCLCVLLNAFQFEFSFASSCTSLYSFSNFCTSFIASLRVSSR